MKFDLTISGLERANVAAVLAALPGFIRSNFTLWGAASGQVSGNQVGSILSAGHMAVNGATLTISPSR